MASIASVLPDPGDFRAEFVTKPGALGPLPLFNPTYRPAGPLPRPVTTCDSIAFACAMSRAMGNVSS
jgi:hypothetical protein